MDEMIEQVQISRKFTKILLGFRFSEYGETYAKKLPAFVLYIPYLSPIVYTYIQYLHIFYAVH
jgi:hypothetical protein